jgi:Protein of unknown function (DUF1566)
MKRALSYAAGIIGLALGVVSLGLIVLGMVVFAASPAGAATAAGPYYATPSWDQQLPASTRFVVLSNWVDAAHPSGGAAVLDRETGLVWEQSPSTTGDIWYGQSVHCINLNTGGRTGWRLPTIQELLSLVDRSQSNPSLPSGHPFTVQSSAYWSATTYASNTAVAWFVNVANSSVDRVDKSVINLLAWCLRGGQGVDAQ